MRQLYRHMQADAAGLVQPLRKKLSLANTAYRANSPASQLRHHRGETFGIIRWSVNDHLTVRDPSPQRSLEIAKH